jgi:hypothetical protein
MSHIEESVPVLRVLRAKLAAHPLYAEVDDARRLSTFMASHVFAVWDFMTLLKALQRRLTVVTLPWLPPKDAASSRLVNEIVLAEESDRLPDGTVTSHFALYVRAMHDVGADTSMIDAFIDALGRGVAVFDALATADVPMDVRTFVQSTLEVAEHGHVEEIAAFFLYGREDPIPSMFTSLLASLPDDTRTATMRTYLERHVELDGDEHGHAAEALLDRLVGDDAERRARAHAAARRAIEARIALWDGVRARLPR